MPHSLRYDVPDNRIDIVLDGGGTSSLWWTTKNEWLGLVDVAGLEVEALYGGFDGRAADGGKPRVRLRDARQAVTRNSPVAAARHMRQWSADGDTGTEVFSLTTSDLGPCHVLTLRGELDEVAAPILGEAIEEDTGSPLIVDLSGLEFICSAGIHVLLRGKAPAAIVCPPGNIARVLGHRARGAGDEALRRSRRRARGAHRRPRRRRLSPGRKEPC